MSRPREHDDKGFAIVVALLVTAIAFVVMAGVLAQAIHNVALSGIARRRLAAVNAAEAGLNWYANQIGTSSLTALGGPGGGLGWSLGGCPPVSSGCWYLFAPTNSAAVVATSPEKATFEIRVLYSRQNPCRDPSTGASSACAIANVPASSVLSLVDTSAQPFPDTAYAIVRATGRVGSVSRTLETYVRIRAIRDNVQGGVSAVSLCLGPAARVTVVGNLAVDNQALGGSRPIQFDAACPETYATGDLWIKGGGGFDLLLSDTGEGGSLSVKGGGVHVDNTTRFVVRRDVWAEGAVAIGSGSPLSDCPTSGTIQCVYGDAVGASVVIGSNAAVLGDVLECSPLPCPPPVAFPEITWNAADWRAPWTVSERASTSGLLTAMGAASTPTVFHITSSNPSACDLYFNGGSVDIHTDVAVISSCRFVFTNNSTTINNVGGSNAVLLISASPAASCGTSSSFPYGPHDISVEQNPQIATGLFLYTPCILWLGNNQDLSGDLKGQFAARYIIAKNQVVLTENAIGQFVSSIPGVVSRFFQDVKFVREIPTTTAETYGGP